MNYAVITENDESKWKDQTGILYHFPSKYKNRLVTGTDVIYYKGKMRNRNYIRQRLSKEPHYFGIATIGKVYPDPKNDNEFFAEIEDYIPFSQPILFKDENNEYLENVTKSNYWRDGVRFIDNDIYTRIITRTNYEIERYNNNVHPLLTKSNLPNLDLVNPDISKNIFISNEINGEKGYLNHHISKDKKDSSQNRISKNAKVIGDRAEEVVLKYLKEHNFQNVKWIAQEGEKPGYDISCLNHNGDNMFIEVKGTSTNKFMNFIITNNELIAAEKLDDSYYIFFVAECISRNPKIQVVDNPFKKINSGKWNTTPISYKVTFN